jgi:hypothetical protein
VLEYLCNGRVDYRVRGVHVGLADTGVHLADRVVYMPRERQSRHV